jgi:hypothetical protein
VAALQVEVPGEPLAAAPVAAALVAAALVGVAAAVSDRRLPLIASHTDNRGIGGPGFSRSSDAYGAAGSFSACSAAICNIKVRVEQPCQRSSWGAPDSGTKATPSSPFLCSASATDGNDNLLGSDPFRAGSSTRL